MAASVFIGRQALSAAVIVGVLPSLCSPLTARASLLPPASRSQLIHTFDFRPSRAIPFVITPERRAMLNTIRFAEGTWRGGLDEGYRVMFGGGLMPSFDRHPNRMNYTSRNSSAAAGAYQFMPFTWNLIQRNIGVRGFGPEAQDQGALFLIQRRKALALTDSGILSPLLAAMLAPEWASFPTLGGRSYYGQPVKNYASLRSFYDVNLAELRRLRDVKRQVLVVPPPALCTGSRIECATRL